MQDHPHEGENASLHRSLRARSFGEIAYGTQGFSVALPQVPKAHAVPIKGLSNLPVGEKSLHDESAGSLPNRRDAPSDFGPEVTGTTPPHSCDQQAGEKKNTDSKRCDDLLHEAASFARAGMTLGTERIVKSERRTARPHGASSPLIVSSLERFLVDIGHGNRATRERRPCPGKKPNRRPSSAAHSPG